MVVIFLTLIKCCKYIEIWMIWFYDKEAGFKQMHMECQTNEILIREIWNLRFMRLFSTPFVEIKL